MKMFKRKSPIQRLGHHIKDSLDPGGTNFSLSALGSMGSAQQGQGPEGCSAGQGQGRKGRPGCRRSHGSHSSERWHLLAQAPPGGGEGRFVKLRTVAVLAAGYIMGARAGNERYAQILDGVAKASRRLEELISHRPPAR
jgi:hypothetical protein